MLTSSKSTSPGWRNCSVSYMLVAEQGKMGRGGTLHTKFAVPVHCRIWLWPVETRLMLCGLWLEAVQGRTVAVLCKESDSTWSVSHAHLALPCSVVQKCRLPALWQGQRARHQAASIPVCPIHLWPDGGKQEGEVWLEVSLGSFVFLQALDCI